ncbi:HDOD domain-containing protein [Cognaticolwellia mytili]|uniref:HDOD domain-containing protein n=1 Tax=Cognaticolwellia mytili TaxID=1888913 RepID=UPI000A171121|nr:HDOD domain-containing protein [Cognaticolwellia mytili]
MKILLIDNLENQLLDLKQEMHRSRAKFAHVIGLHSAVSALSQHAFNIVVCAAEIDGSDGRAMLEMVAKKFPKVVRILIDNDESKPQGIAHYCFAQPIESKTIINTISQLAGNNQAITKDIIVKTIASIKTLPSPPKVYMQLNAVLKNNSTDSHAIAKIIQQDPALTAKVLQFSNNTFATSGKPMMNISDAITKIGIDTLCCIVMTAELFSYNPKIKNFSILDEQLHCLATAKLTASLVKPELKQDAMIAGLLHDIGKVILFEVNEKSTDLFFKHRVNDGNNMALEHKLFAIDHCHVGGYLLHTWGFSYQVIEAVILHHTPNKLLQKSFGIAQAVYLANILIHKQEPATEFIEHYKLAGVIDALSRRAEKLI